jgi:CubicO group peptidase (beta-lactamase class C family)
MARGFIKTYLIFFLVGLFSACSVSTPTTLPPTSTEPLTQAAPIKTMPAATTLHTPTVTSTSIEPDYWPTDGWLSSTPEEQGVDSQVILDMMEYLLGKEYDFHSLLVIRNGYVILDSYIYPFEEGINHNLYSVTKSFVGSLVGITIDEGYVDGASQGIMELFPGRSVNNLDDAKESTTLADLLSMSSGWECPDDEFGGLGSVSESEDWVQAMLDLPALFNSGEQFKYCNTNSHLLSAIIHESTGMSAMEFAQENLFVPLGITSAQWQADPQGNSLGWSNIFMTPHDMARLGLLYLNDGRWEGEQVISSEWVKDATSKQIDVNDSRADGYGYQWWGRDDGVYMARGWGGQYIVIVPDLDMVAVFTASIFGEDKFSPALELLDEYIIPSASSDAPLPANPDAVEQLDRLIESLATPPTDPIIKSELSETISGKKFVMDENPAGFQFFTLTFQKTQAVLRYTVSEDSVRDRETLIVTGLGNNYKFIPYEYGMLLGSKGWWESENEFVIELNLIGIASEEPYTRYELSFSDDQVFIEAWEWESGQTATYSGRLVE